MRTSEIMNPAFHNNIRAHLYEQHHNQRWLAGELDMAPASLSKVLHGTRRLRKPLVLAITRVLRLPPDEQNRLLGMLNYDPLPVVDLNSISFQEESVRHFTTISTEELLNRIQSLEKRVDRLTSLVEGRMTFQTSMNFES